MGCGVDVRLSLSAGFIGGGEANWTQLRCAADNQKG
jgi:hypothetical protein